MTDADTNEPDDSNRWLSRWMIGVVYYAFIALHLVIIVTGYLVYRQRD